MGIDRLAPRAPAMVSDTTAALFVDVGMAAEGWRGWPMAARGHAVVPLFRYP